MNATCRAALFLVALCETACVHGARVSVVERSAVPSSDRTIGPDAVAIFTGDTGPPRRPYRRIAGLVVRLHKAFWWGFAHFGYLRELRSSAAELGCNAIIVGPQTEAYDDLVCGGFDASPVPCFYEYRAACIEMD